jgi:GTP cyclohydrolase II
MSINFGLFGGLNSQNGNDAVSIRRSVKIPLNRGEGTFFSFSGLADGKEHIAIGFGDWAEQDAPLARLHSECLTGDVFASGKCDCGEQLNEAVDRMRAEGGLLLYLRQEGRNIGLYNKLDAYELQRQGHDTYEANRLLGFPDDSRDFTVAAQMLCALGKTSIRLLSNNPEKRSQLSRLGITVVSVENTGVFLKETNRSYLETKAVKGGHELLFVGGLA